MSGPEWATETRNEPVWADDDLIGVTDDGPGEYPSDGLVTLRYLWTAVRRHTRIWIIAVILGLGVGLALPVVLPPPSVATVKLLLSHRDGDDAEQAMATDASMATTRTVAQRVIDELGLALTPDELLELYTAIPLTNRILEITVSAESDARATEIAETLGTTVLQFRLRQAESQLAPLRDDLDELQSRIESLESELGEAASLTDDPEFEDLPRPLRDAIEEETRLEQRIEDRQVAVSTMSSSRTLDEAAPVDESVLKSMAINLMSGLVAGLAVGVGFVVVRALVSDRLWRRDEIAHALGASVRLSVGAPRRRWWPPIAGVFGRAWLGRKDAGAVVQHLRGQVTTQAFQPTLVIVNVDNPRPCAQTVVTLARSFADEGRPVLAVDLTTGGTLAQMFGVTSTGTSEAQVGGGNATVTVHWPTDPDLPTDGLLHGLGREDASPERSALVDAWIAADVVLTFTDLSPALGADHLRSWSTHAVVVVTAGRSSLVRVRAVGEMLRHAGVRLGSAVVLGADRTDDSLGLLSDDPSSTVPQRSSDFGVVRQ